MKLPRLRHLSILTVGGALLCNSPWVLASFVPCAILEDQPGLVLMIDGQDLNTSVAFEIAGRSRGAGLDFGFMTGNTFSPLGNGWHQKESRVFAGGAMVDFAVRSMGADKRFGTSDDQIFRLSDPAHYANQYYSGAISPWKSVDPAQAGTSYRNLTMLWDVDHDGVTDLKITLHTRNAHDGMHFVVPPTSVPLPAAVWLLGTGLAGLTALARRRGARRSA